MPPDMVDAGLATLAAALPLALAFWGVYVTLKPVSPEKHKYVIWGFLMVGIVASFCSGLFAYHSGQQLGRIEKNTANPPIVKIENKIDTAPLVAALNQREAHRQDTLKVRTLLQAAKLEKFASEMWKKLPTYSETSDTADALKAEHKQAMQKWTAELSSNYLLHYKSSTSTIVNELKARGADTGDLDKLVDWGLDPRQIAAMLRDLAGDLDNDGQVIRKSKP